MKVCVDPGHGGADPGAVGVLLSSLPTDLAEKDVNWSVSCLVADKLGYIERLGSRAFFEDDIMLSRNQAESVSLTERASRANEWGADLFVSIHCNAAHDPAAEGFEVFHAGTEAGSRLAEDLINVLAAELPDHRNRGAKTARFQVLRETAMPAVLIELEFLSNPRRLEFLANYRNQARLAGAIASWIAASADTRGNDE